MPPIEMQLSPGQSPNGGVRGDPLPVGTTIARYRIEALIGSGAMGDVYRARDRVLDRDVALKVLPTELVNDRERVQRFAQEARAASALSHPHIVTVHEVGHAHPTTNVRPIAGARKPRRTEVHYIAMEYVDGKTLREALRSLTVRRAIEILEQVAEGLGKAHAAGIIHRDLKPENILVATEGYAKIVDFGLAKLVDPAGGWNPIGADSPTLRALTQNGELIGTPGYMSPEQVTGKPLDQRTDIFSFGCILYEAITRQRPFEAESFVDTLYKILHEQLPPIPHAPAELQRIVQKCLAKEREERYHSIRDVALDLREWLGLHRDIEPIAIATLASRPTVSLRRWLAIAAIVAIVAVLPALAYILFRDRESAPVAVPFSTIAPEQRTARRVTSSGRATQVAISPDGRYLAYVTTQPDGPSVMLEQIETRSPLQIVPPMDAIYVALTFSRDGNYLYFVRYDSGPIGSLYRVPILGGKPERIVSDIDTRVTFSPAGDEIAFVRDDYNRAMSMLVVASTDGLSERVLATFRISNRIWSPSWSADGKRIVVAQRGKLVSIDSPSGAFRRIASNFRFDEVRNTTWTPSGSLIVAASSAESEGRFRLWEIDPETSEGHALTDALMDVVGPAISGDGRTIAALQVVRRASLFEVDANGTQSPLAVSAGAASGMGRIAWMKDRLLYASASDGATDLWSLDVARGETTQLTRERSWELQPTPSPDGTWIYYSVSNAQNHSTIWRVRPDGTERRRVTDGPRDADFAIAPDSKTIAWSSLDPKSNEWVLWSQSVDGGERKRLASRGNVLQSVHFTRDGKSIVFVGYAESQLRLYRVAASGGAVESISDKAATDPDLSSAGDLIACAFDYGNDAMNAPLGIISLPDGKVTTLQTSGARYTFRPGASDVTFVREDGAMTQNLWLQSLRGGEPRKLTNFEEGSIAGYAWSADGKRLAGTHVVQSSDVVLIRR